MREEIVVNETTADKKIHWIDALAWFVLGCFATCVVFVGIHWTKDTVNKITVQNYQAGQQSIRDSIYQWQKREQERQDSIWWYKTDSLIQTFNIK